MDRPPSLPARSAAIALAAAALATVLAASGGCELAIGDAVPAFACNPGPATCPDGQVCDPESHQCVLFCTVTSCPGSMQCDFGSHLCGAGDASVSDASADNLTDAPVEQDGSVPLGDTGSGDDTAPQDGSAEMNQGDTGACSGVMCKCSGAASCIDSHICADQLTVGPGLFMAAGSAAFCAKPCCTSADCDPTTVCYATGVGGNYCVLPAWLQRSTTLGTSVGGQMCSGDANCRSGLCANGMCADTCCSTPSSATECSAGSTCSFGTFPGAPMDASAVFDQNYTAFCSGAGGTGTNGSPCNFSSDCASNRCDPRTRICRDACRNTSACTGGGFACEYRLDSMTNSVFATCQLSNGMTPMGGACLQDGDCQTEFCNPMGNVCTDVCFGDSDCTAVQNWRCRPEQLALQGGGSAAVLCCGL
jgi:hypothetical protein